MAEMAASLVGLHHTIDPKRFFLPDGVEQGYRHWFSRELRNEDAILLVAHDDGVIAGYLYGRIEARDWNMLLDRHAALHDVFVAETSRKRRVGEALVDAFCALVRTRGVPRVVLHTAASNTSAQALFTKFGFRVTMLEMTREL
jgi:ribosomal protein S18 acetylase RimI-like enzyme